MKAFLGLILLAALIACQEVPQPQPTQPPIVVMPTPITSPAPAWTPDVPDFTKGSSVSIYGCNAVAFSALPQTDMFVGRVINGGGCDESLGYSLVLVHMDWPTLTMTQTAVLLQSPATFGDGRTIARALDPAVAVYAGKTWVAFECEYGGITSISAGPLNNDNTLDLANTHVLVSGDAKGSASEPNFLVYNGTLYLYWIRVNLATGSMTTRGTTLTANGSQLIAASATTNGGTEVFGNIGDASNNASIFQAFAATDGSIVLSAQKNGNLLAIGTTTTPLAQDGFNYASWIPDAQLPTAQAGYYRFVKRSTDGATVLLGGSGAFCPPGVPGGPAGLCDYALVWPDKLLSP